MLGIILDHSRRKSAAIELKLFAIASLESLLRLRSSHTLVLEPEKRVHVARQADCFLSEHEYLTIFLIAASPIAVAVRRLAATGLYPTFRLTLRNEH